MIAGLDQLIRFKIIHERLKEKTAPTLEQLKKRVESKLGKPIGKRTLQYDIQNLRHNKLLGALAPIEYVKATGRYRYSDPDYCLFSALKKIS